MSGQDCTAAKPFLMTKGTASPRCRSGRHIFDPFTPSDDLGGGAQRCECGKLLIDRTLGGGRVVEINGPDFVGPSRSRIGRMVGL